MRKRPKGYGAFPPRHVRVAAKDSTGGAIRKVELVWAEGSCTASTDESTLSGGCVARPTSDHGECRLVENVAARVIIDRHGDPVHKHAVVNAEIDRPGTLAFASSRRLRRSQGIAEVERRRVVVRRRCANTGRDSTES